MERLSENPFLGIYKKSALVVVLEAFEGAAIQGIPEVVDWIKDASKNLPEDALKEPTIKIAAFESYVLSLFRLAQGATDIKRFAPDYEPIELEEAAALLLASSLVRREAANKPTPVSSTEDGEDAAKRRNWKVVEDAIGDLKEYEDELVEYGEAILSKNKELLRTWSEDQDDGSFADAAGDVRRRLDFVATHSKLFLDTVVDAEFLKKGEDLHTDAWSFYRGREGRQVPKTRLTLARDQAFTLLLERLERLQKILKAVYRKDAEARQKIEGGYWKRLSNLTRPRRKRASDKEA